MRMMSLLILYIRFWRKRGLFVVPFFLLFSSGLAVFAKVANVVVLVVLA